VLHFVKVETLRLECRFTLCGPAASARGRWDRQEGSPYTIARSGAGREQLAEAAE
jgi:hypothetical protein